MTPMQMERWIAEIKDFFARDRPEDDDFAPGVTLYTRENHCIHTFTSYLAIGMRADWLCITHEDGGTTNIDPAIITRIDMWEHGPSENLFDTLRETLAEMREEYDRDTEEDRPTATGRKH